MFQVPGDQEHTDLTRIFTDIQGAEIWRGEVFRPQLWPKPFSGPQSAGPDHEERASLAALTYSSRSRSCRVMTSISEASLAAVSLDLASKAREAPDLVDAIVYFNGETVPPPLL